MAFDAGAVKGRALFDDTDWQKGMDGLDQSNQKLNKSLKGVKTGLLAIGAAATAALTASIVKANEFNKEFANVTTLVDTAKVNTRAMKQELLALDNRLGSATELTKGLYQALSAGQEPAKAVQFVGEAAKFAKAGLVDTATSVDVLTTVLNAYKLESEDTARVSDVLFQTIKLGKTTGQELASSLGNVIPIAAALDVQVEELGAAVATMTKQGIKSDVAMTQLKAVFSAFLKPSTALTKALEKNGIASGEMLLKTEGLQGALKFLQEETGGSSEELSAMLPNVRALQGALALTGEQTDVFVDTLMEMENAAGSTNIAFEKQETTVATFQNTVDELLVVLGDKLFPTFTKVVGAGTKLIEIFTGLVKESPATAIEKERDAFNALVMELADANTEEGRRKELIEDINKIDDTFLKNLNTEKIDMGQLAERLDRVNDGYFRRIILAEQENKIKEVTKKVSDETTAKLKLERQLREEVANATMGTVSSQDLLGKSTDELIQMFKDSETGFMDVGQQNDIYLEKLNKLEKTQAKIEMRENNLLEIKDELAEEQEVLNEIQRIYTTELDENSRATEENTKKKKKNITTTKDLGEETKTVFAEITEAQEDWINSTNDALGKIGSAITFFTDAIGDAFQKVTDLFTMSSENRIAVMENELADEMKKLQNQREEKLNLIEMQAMDEQELVDQQLEQGLITQEEHALATNEIERNRKEQEIATNEGFDAREEKMREKKRNKINAEEKKVFEANKANQIAQVWIEAAAGIVAAWAGAIQALAWIPTVGPALAITFGSILSGLMTGFAIAETVVISQQQFIPKKAIGGRASGLNIINERGGEMVVLPDNSIVVPNDISRQIASMSVGRGKNGGNNISVSFAGANISDNMSLRKVSNFVVRDLAKRLRLAD